MGNRLLYEDDLGRISKILPGPEGTFLLGGRSFGWRLADAANITYTSTESGPIANVSVALDQTLLMIKRLQLTVSALEAENKRIDGQQNDMLAALRMEVADLNRFFQEIATRVTRASHQKATLSIASNPALALDSDRQTISLNLAAKGSFDDSRAGLKANSIQLALEALAAKQKEMSYTVSFLQDTINGLQATIESYKGD